MKPIEEFLTSNQERTEREQQNNEQCEIISFTYQPYSKSYLQWYITHTLNAKFIEVLKYKQTHQYVK